MNHENTFKWSNCLIEAVRQKMNRNSDIDVKFIITGFHFHVMWFDRADNMVHHFTHKYSEGFHCDLMFYGCRENLTIDEFNAYCRKIDRTDLIITR